MNAGSVSNCRGIRKNGGFNQQKTSHLCIAQTSSVYFSSVSRKNVVTHEPPVSFLSCKTFKHMTSDANFALKPMTRLCSCRKEKENPLPATTSLHTVLSLILVNDARSPMIDFLVSSFNLNRPSLICIIFGSVPCMFMRNDCFSVAYSTHPLLIMSGNFQSSFHINHAFVEDGRWIC